MARVVEAEGPDRPRRRHRARNWLIGIAVAVVALVIIGRLVLDPIAAHYTQQALDKNPNLRGSFSGVHVSVLPPAYEIRRIKILEQPGGKWDEPLFYAERAQVSVLWRELFKGHLVARAVVDDPKVVAVRQHEKKAEKGADIGESLEDAVPVKLDELQVHRGEVLVAQGIKSKEKSDERKGKPAPQLWIHGLDLTVTNLATRKDMMDGDPGKLSLSGKVQRSGDLAVVATFDPFAKKPTFTTKGALEHLDARELYAFLADNAEMHPSGGEINLFVEAKAREGVLSGGVKPVIKGLELVPSKNDLGTRLKTWFADAGVELLSDDIPGRDAVATVIPIKGTIDDAQTQLVPTVLGVVRNAFVVGLQSGFTDLPPKTAEKKEGVVKQAWHALTKGGDDPPEAQPADHPAGDKQDGDKARRQGRAGKDQNARRAPSKE